MKIVATIQVRMESSRLPGKVMKEILGKPMLGHMIERLARARRLNEVVVATSVNPSNDVIEDYCRCQGVACFRGSEEDVLGRVLGALNAHKAHVGVEIFGDSPFVDPDLTDEFVNFFLSHKDEFDFVSNDLKTTYPPGAEIEVYHVCALEDAARRTNDPKIREHGTLFIRQHPEIYRLHNIEAPPELNYPEMEIELDTAEDLEVARQIYAAFYPRKKDFSIKDVVSFLQQNPKVMDRNKNVPRRWKEFRKS